VNVDKKLVIIGGGPAGHSAASAAARRGVSVTLIEREILGGAAHLLDCVPSKAMIATGGAMSFTDNLSGMGLENRTAEVDVEALTSRIESIKTRLSSDVHNCCTAKVSRSFLAVLDLPLPTQCMLMLLTGQPTFLKQTTFSSLLARARAFLHLSRLMGTAF
jgi:dihydrolipoamide dehydrogenase